MRGKARRKKRESPASEESGDNPQSSGVASGIFLLILAGGCFFGAFIYFTSHATSCHLDWGSNARFSSQIFNLLLRGICGLFTGLVSDPYKPAAGAVFFSFLGLICLGLAWRKFASVGK